MIKENLPRLLREDEHFRYEIKGLLAETFSSKDELQAVLEEIRTSREDTNRRFEETNQQIAALREDTNRRFEEVNRRFDRLDEYTLRIHRELTALSGRLGRGLEEVIRQILQEFSGQRFTEIKRLVLEDEQGEVFGAPTQIEFDAYLEDTDTFVVEVKSHARTDDIFNLKRKVEYARTKLQKALIPVLICASIDQRAKRLCDESGIRVIFRSIL